MKKIKVPLTGKLLVILFLKMETVCFSGTILSTIRPRLYGLEYQTLSVNCLFVLSLFKDDFTTQITQA